MKKIVAILMSAFIMLSMFPAMAFAKDTTSEDKGFGFYVENNKAIIVDYKADEISSQTFEIPSKLKGYPVSEISFNWEISLKSSVKKIVIPSTVVKIKGIEFGNAVRHNLVVDCTCGSTAEKWSLQNGLSTSNGVTKTVVTTATEKHSGKLQTTCNKCKKSYTYTIPEVDEYGVWTNAAATMASYYYTGKNRSVSTEVTDSDGNNLVRNVDYTISGPSTVKNVGKYSFTITLKGWYSGVIKDEGAYVLAFEIIPKSTSIKKLSRGKKSFTVKWKKQSTQTTGYQIRYSTKSSMSKAKTITVKGNKKTSKKIKHLKSKKKYYVQVRTYKTVKGKKYALPWDEGRDPKKVKTK